MTKSEAVATSSSFEAFYEEEHRGLFGALYLITGSSSDAEDLMQEAFLRVWQRWDRIQSLDNPSGYLFRTAMNTLRMSRRRAAILARRLWRLIPGAGSNAIDPMAEIDLRDQVWSALLRLTERQRAAIVLTELLGYNSDEAGSLLGIRPVTVRVLASQARASLRDSIEGEGG